MTPLEELQAAHKRLSQFREQASGGPWLTGDWNPAPGWGHTQVVASHDGEGDVTDYIDAHDVQLIITLHRTIDAQLAMLQYACRVIADEPSAAVAKALVWNELALAVAINAEAS